MALSAEKHHPWKNLIYHVRPKTISAVLVKVGTAFSGLALAILLATNGHLSPGPAQHSDASVDVATTLPLPTGRSSTSLTEPVLVHAWDTLHQSVASDTRPGSTENGHRLVFIGDIHGCIDELKALLNKVEYNSEKDHIITTGDMVNKGPNSAAVLELLRLQKASCVRGNHDDKILHVRSGFQGMRQRDESGGEFIVASSLSDAQVAYLSSCPVILHLGELENMDLVVVHAGLVPSVPLHRQVAHDVMNMRIIDVATHQSSAKHEAKGSVHWFKLWNKYQAMSTAERHVFAHRQSSVDMSTRTVIYGHDAKKGLQLHEYTKGLDSKCVAGGKLTALVLSHEHGEQIFQVDCDEYVK